MPMVSEFATVICDWQKSTAKRVKIGIVTMVIRYNQNK